MEYFYFHNFIYETVWKDNRRRQNERIYTEDIIHKYSADYKILFVGDATMAPYEITNAGGSIEHWNEEPGSLWMKKFYSNFEKLSWLWNQKRVIKKNIIIFVYFFVDASFKIHSINLIKLIPLNAAISGTRESFVIPG